METCNVNRSLRVALNAPDINLEEEREDQSRSQRGTRSRSAAGSSDSYQHCYGGGDGRSAFPHLHCWFRLQVLQAHVFQLQLVGQSQNLDVCGRQARVVPRLLGELRHWETGQTWIRRRVTRSRTSSQHCVRGTWRGCVQGEVTLSDVFGVWFFEVQLVGQEGQAPPGGFVSDLVHHILQGVDVLADILEKKPETAFTVNTDPSHP